VLTLVVGDAAALDHGNKVVLRKAGKGGPTKMRILRQEVRRGNIAVGEIATPAAGDTNPFAQACRVIHQQDAPATAARLCRAHHAGCTGANNDYVKAHLKTDCSRERNKFRPEFVRACDATEKCDNSGMDPLTHALLGATAAQAAFGPRLGRKAWLIGATGGVLPDADILIKSATDPLLAIEYHRHFTHSFAFIPVGGFLAALPWLVQARFRAERAAVFGAAVAGYATHGLLDACTNYGTHLLWPFSDSRTAWHWITTIGPLLSVMLLVGLVLAVKRGSRAPALVALLLGLSYVGAAAWQRERALDVQALEAAARGHVIARADMFPTVGNHFIWRSSYQSGNTLYTDRVRLMGKDSTRWKDGGSVALLTEDGLSADSRADDRVMRDFSRFKYFSAGWVARASTDPSVIGDARYSLRTDRFEPIWGVRFHPGTAAPTEWFDQTASNRIPLSELWAEITGTAPGYRAPAGGPAKN
jgi:inner membrane protein